MLQTACGGHPQLLPPPPRPAAGYWFDAFRAQRAQLADPQLLAGAAKIKITPRPGAMVAGHGFNKHSSAVLDDLWVRVLYLDSGREAVALVSLDLIGFSLPRVERIRARLTERFGGRILIASTHNHAGPDTLGYWGPALLYLLPLRSGIDEDYLAWVEERAAEAVQRAVGRARPARLFLGRFLFPEGLAYNMREAGDVDRTVTVLRAAAKDGFTIGTLVDCGVHAESLQDNNRLFSADFPGVLYREVDRALGGVTLFFTGPAGGMIEPDNRPEDPEPARLAFRERLGGALAEGTILQAVGGMEEIDGADLRVRSLPLRLPIQVGALLDLAIQLGLIDPRPVADQSLQTEMALVDLGKLRLLTIPGEVTPEVGRLLQRELKAAYPVIVGLGMDELGYMLSDRQWADPRFEYERTMSLGPGTTPRILQAARTLAASPVP